MAMTTDELLIYILGSPSHFLAKPMATWLAASRQFTAFATTFRDKIRKKVRTTQDTESLLDLRLELETAYLLLQAKRLSLVYEPQQAGQNRCPDFAVTFTTSYTFMVEVTRLRAGQRSSTDEAEVQTAASDGSLSPPFIDERLADTICSKLGQLLAQHSNVLVVGVETLPLTPTDLRAMMLHIQQRAEQGEATFLQRYRWRSRSDFFRYYLRLSEVLVRGPQVSAVDPTVAWINPQAKHPLPSKVRTALYRSRAV